MAVFKHSRASGCETNPFFLELFRDRSEPDERERMWQTAMAHAGEGTPPLRFPVYKTLYLINLYSQKLIDLLEDASKRFGIDRESHDYRQSLIQMVRSETSQGITEYMNEVEMTDEWLFERLWRKEQLKLRDPEDAYLEVRRQEADRIDQGLPPRVQFLSESPVDASSNADLISSSPATNPRRKRDSE